MNVCCKYTHVFKLFALLFPNSKDSAIWQKACENGRMFICLQKTIKEIFNHQLDRRLGAPTISHLPGTLPCLFVFRAST